MSDETLSFRFSSPILGLRPYTLIELRPASDGSGEPSLFVEAGGGAEEDPLAMPLLVITECEPEKSEVARMLRGLVESGDYDRTTLEKVVREFNPDWLPFVLGS
jgi:hypothetical protein